MTPRQEELHLVLENEGDLHRTLVSAITLGAGARKVRDLITRFVQARRLKPNIRPGGGTISYYLATVYLLRGLKDSTNIPHHTLDVLMANVKDQHRVYLNQRTTQVQEAEQREVREAMNAIMLDATDFTNTEQENTTMTNTTGELKTITLLDGQDVSTYSDDDIFKLIGKLENEQARYNNLNHKPEKLRARIEEIEVKIAGLVKLVDERD